MRYWSLTTGESGPADAPGRLTAALRAAPMPCDYLLCTLCPDPDETDPPCPVP